MSLLESSRYLLDVNVLIALAARGHIHHQLVRTWFYASTHLQWLICAFTEAGFVRVSTASRPNQITLEEATAVLRQWAQHPGYAYLPIVDDWQTLCGPLFPRLHGTQQITDAYLVGLAVRHDLTLVTMDKAIVHLAGNAYATHVLLLHAVGQMEQAR